MSFHEHDIQALLNASDLQRGQDDHLARRLESIADRARESIRLSLTPGDVDAIKVVAERYRREGATNAAEHALAAAEKIAALLPPREA